MKPDRIRQLCQELDDLDPSSDPALRMTAISTVARREQIPLPLLYALSNRFASLTPGKDRLAKSTLKAEPKSVQAPVQLAAGHPVQPARQFPLKTRKVEICMGKACQAKGSAAILEHFQILAARPSPSSEPQITYKVKTCSCLGRCGKAPVVILDKKIHDKFNPDE